MKPYIDLLKQVVNDGELRTDRTGTGTLSVFGTQSRYDLRDGFPLVTIKKVPFRSVALELLWFLRGDTNTADLGCGIWDEWASADGELGPIYGAQWRGLGSCRVDQISEALRMIKETPDSRRIIVSAWNVDDLHRMALPPCHTMFQFYVAGKYLDLQLYQRSADLALGVPFNVASYALLLTMFAKECNLTPRYFVHSIGDAHIYCNHLGGVAEMLLRQPRGLPDLQIADKPVLEQTLNDITLVGYDPHPPIRFEIAV